MCTWLLVLLVGADVAVAYPNAEALYNRDKSRFKVGIVDSEFDLDTVVGKRVAMRVPGRLDNVVCVIPDPLPAAETVREDADDDVVNAVKVIGELKSMMKSLDSACLYKLDGWWTYEFCTKKSTVRQFHSEEATGLVNAGNEHFLGRQLDPASMQLTATYLSETYSDGSVCDLTSTARTIEVRYYCDTSREVSWLDKLSEPQSCKYMLAVRSPIPCAHKHFGATQKPPTDIRCQLTQPVSFERAVDVASSPAPLSPEMVDATIDETQRRTRLLRGGDPARVMPLATVFESLYTSRSRPASSDARVSADEFATSTRALVSELRLLGGAQLADAVRGALEQRAPPGEGSAARVMQAADDAVASIVMGELLAALRAYRVKLAATPATRTADAARALALINALAHALALTRAQRLELRSALLDFD